MSTLGMCLGLDPVTDLLQRSRYGRTARGRASSSNFLGACPPRPWGRGCFAVAVSLVGLESRGGSMRGWGIGFDRRLVSRRFTAGAGCSGAGAARSCRSEFAADQPVPALVVRLPSAAHAGEYLRPDLLQACSSNASWSSAASAAFSCSTIILS